MQTERTPWRPGADVLPVADVKEKADEWTNNGMGNSAETAWSVALAFGRRACAEGDRIIKRMIESAR